MQFGYPPIALSTHAVPYTSREKHVWLIGITLLQTVKKIEALAVVVDVGMALMSMIMAAPIMLMVTPRTVIRI